MPGSPSTQGAFSSRSFTQTGFPASSVDEVEQGGVFARVRANRVGTPPTAGFTLIELMIVMVIIGLLAAIAVPAYIQNVRHAREAVLREDLHTIRSAIDSYTIDKQKAPQTLDDLVQAGYLKVMPVDPFTHRSDTWQPTQTDALQSLDQTDSGIGDVHSGAQMLAADGTSYNTW